MFKKLIRFYEYYMIYGSKESLKFLKYKFRASIARNPLGWLFCYQLNPFVLAGKLEYNKISFENLNKFLKEQGVTFQQLCVDINDFEDYFASAKYHRWPDYYSEFPAEIRREKYFQHYISIKLLGIKENDVFIDIGSNNSPIKEIVREMFSAQTYSLDLSYKPGIHGDRIGCDAGNTGLPEAFASKLALHCSFEHFENDTDINFIKEASRILLSGGKVCIVPLYLYDNFVIHQDPTLECNIRVNNKGGPGFVM